MDGGGEGEEGCKGGRGITGTEESQGVGEGGRNDKGIWRHPEWMRPI